MKKNTLFLALIFMASVSYMSAQNFVLKNQEATAVKTELLEQNSQAKNTALLTYLGGSLANVLGNDFAPGTRYVSGCIDFTAAQMANYVGAKLWQICVPIPSAQFMTGFTEAKVWIKHSLSGPVIYEQTFVPVLQDWNEIELAEPQTIVEGALVIGFTTTHVLTATPNSNVRPLWCSNATDPYKPGGFNYILGTNPNQHATGANWNQYISLGNLGIEGYLVDVPAIPQNDLAASTLSSLPLKWVDNPTTYTVNVFNAGTAPQNNYTVQIIDADNNVLGSQNVTTALAAGASTNIEIAVTPTAAGILAVRGKVILTGDENPNNDISAPLIQRVYPMQPMAYCDNSNVTGVAWGANVPHQAAIEYSMANMGPFTGKVLTAIEVAFNPPASTISDCKVWIRSSLTGSNLYEQPFTPGDGWTKVQLTTPYELQNADIFIGWSAQSTENYIIGCTQNTPVVFAGGHIQGGTNAWSNYASQTNPMPYNNAIIGVVSACAPPTNLEVAYTDDCEALLTWDAPNGATAYNIYRNATLVKENHTQTSYTDEGFDFMVGHVWSVTVACNDDESDAAMVSEEACFQCDPATNLLVEFEDDCGIAILSWTAPAEGSGKYNIYRNDDLIVSNHEETTYTDTDFDSEITNTWVVKVVCMEEESDPATKEEYCELGIKGNEQVAFSIVPNPTSGNITISAEKAFHTIEVISFLGQTVLSQYNANNVVSLDVSALTNGVYFVRIISDNGTSVKKFVKQ